MSAENKKERKIPRPVWILGIVAVLAAIVAVVFFVLNPPKKPVRVEYEEAKIDEANFPDAVFREYVRLRFDTDQNGVLSIEELKQAKEIDLSKQTKYDMELPKDENGLCLIHSLKGIGFFVGLEVLDCSYNSLTELDLKRNPKLRSINCSYNVLTTLDIHGDTALEELYCGSNSLSVIDVEECEKRLLRI